MTTRSTSSSGSPPWRCATRQPFYSCSKGKEKFGWKLCSIERTEHLSKMSICIDIVLRAMLLLLEENPADLHLLEENPTDLAAHGRCMNCFIVYKVVANSV
jgi:hypothetical protein